MEPKMERQWVMKNVDLNLLTFRLGDFFKERGFEVIGEKTPTSYEISAQNSSSFRLIGAVIVIIEGEPNDFLLKLELWENRRRYSGYGAFLLNIFGAGYLVRREAESDETWARLKKEFWPYIENLVANLSNTATSSNNDLKTNR
jgi:hypothetical protein